MSNGYISNCTFNGTGASCNIYYYTNEQKNVLEQQAQSELNNILNQKSFTRRVENERQMMDMAMKYG